ncbi:hypothetical protein J6590_056937 [Homalodisca vitripennis]|nr:hypothetical protein J6590_056937 [Homalodisca vitripennis]
MDEFNVQTSVDEAVAVSGRALIAQKNEPPLDPITGVFDSFIQLSVAILNFTPTQQASLEVYKAQGYYLYSNLGLLALASADYTAIKCLFIDSATIVASSKRFPSDNFTLSVTALRFFLEDC